MKITKQFKRIDEFVVAGIQTTTINKDETSTDTAKIGPLWYRFNQEHIFDAIPHKKDTSHCYALYTNYRQTDIPPLEYEYDYLIGASITDDVVHADHYFSVHTVPAGEYLVFSPDGGEMPEKVIKTWEYIWKFFSKQGHIKRSFKGDFERYSIKNGEIDYGSIEIFIGIENS